jgi:hypothetical protein
MNSIIKILLAVFLISMFGILSATSAQIAIRPSWRNYPIYSEARKSLQKSDYKSSIDLLEKAIIEGQSNPAHVVWVYEDLAGVLMVYGEPERALSMLEKMVDLGFGKSYYEYAYLTHSPQYKFLRQSPKWEILRKRAEDNFTDQAKADGDSPEAQMLFQEDQAERLFPPTDIQPQSKDPAQMTISARYGIAQIKSSWNRQQQIKRLIKEKKLRTINDYRAGVFIFQHSLDTKDIQFANRLATTGYALAKNEAERCYMGTMIALTTDRLLWYKGKPQIYGTQSRPANMPFEQSNEVESKINLLSKKYTRRGRDIPEGLMVEVLKSFELPDPKSLTQEPFNRTTVTDEQRKSYCVKTVGK